MVRTVICRFTKKVPGEKGFTVVEVLVAGLVLVVALIFIAQLFTSTAARILASDTRSLMHQIATQEIETIRALQYQDVGTVGGQPPGALLADETKLVEGRSFRIVREVTYIQDPSYSGPFPANYRRATVKVSLANSSALGPVEMSTNVGGGAEGGTLDVTVSDLSGKGISSAQLRITNDILIPRVLISTSAIRTDNEGKLMVPGLTPDPDGGYDVQATKNGYNTTALKQTVVVVKGTPFTVVQLIMDKLATMNVHVTDQDGLPQPDITLNVTGYLSVSPWTFSQTITTDATGNAVLPNIRYSTALEPYFIQLVTPQGLPLELPAGIDPPEIDPKFLPLPAGKIPVLLDPGVTQDVNLVVIIPH